MTVDWGFAGQVGGVGFGLVFAVLVVLALAVWLTGLVLDKLSPGAETKAANKKKGD